MPTKIKIIFFSGLVIAFLLLGGVISITHFGYQKIKTKKTEIEENINDIVASTLTEEEQEEMERFFTEPIEIPVLWQTKETISEEFQREIDTFIKKHCSKNIFFSKWRLFRHKVDFSLSEDWVITNENISEVKTILEEYSSFSEDFIKLVNNPEFSLSSLLKAHSFNMEKINISLGLLQLQIKLWEYERKNPPINSLLTFFELIKTYPASKPEIHRFASQTAIIGSQQLSSKLSRYSNPDELTLFFQRMNQLSSFTQYHLENKENLPGYFILLNDIVSLREKKKEYDLTKKYRGIYYMLLNDPLSSEKKKFDPPHFLKPIEPGFVGIEKIEYVVEKAPHLNTFFCLKKGKVYFDLAHLSVGKRILDLEGKEISEDSLALLFNSQLPIDPFSKKPYLFDSEEKSFFSVGPDEISNDKRLIYDPTNGIISGGDIRLKQEH